MIQKACWRLHYVGKAKDLTLTQLTLIQKQKDRCILHWFLFIVHSLLFNIVPLALALKHIKIDLINFVARIFPCSHL